MKNYIFLLLVIILFTNFQCGEEIILPESVSISGTVYTQSNDGSGELKPLEGVNFKLLSEGEIIATSSNGSFEFMGLEPGIDYTLIPEMNDDNLNGVSTFDVALLRSYLEDSVNFNIRQMIAADMDRSYHINDNDLTILKECIQSPMMLYCLDYRFYLKNCTSLDQRDLINDIQFDDLIEDRLNLEIMVVKSGDVTSE